MALILNFNAAQRAKQLKQPIQIHVIAFSSDDRSHCFYPEMGESRNPTKLLLGGYVYNCYSIRWAEADDEKVRSLHLWRKQSNCAGLQRLSILQHSNNRCNGISGSCNRGHVAPERGQTASNATDD